MLLSPRNWQSTTACADDLLTFSWQLQSKPILFRSDDGHFLSDTDNEYHEDYDEPDDSEKRWVRTRNLLQLQHPVYLFSLCPVYWTAHTYFSLSSRSMTGTEKEKQKNSWLQSGPFPSALSFLKHTLFFQKQRVGSQSVGRKGTSEVTLFLFDQILSVAIRWEKTSGWMLQNRKVK